MNGPVTAEPTVKVTKPSLSAGTAAVQDIPLAVVLGYGAPSFKLKARSALLTSNKVHGSTALGLAVSAL